MLLSTAATAMNPEFYQERKLSKIRFLKEARLSRSVLLACLQEGYVGKVHSAWLRSSCFAHRGAEKLTCPEPPTSTRESSIQQGYWED